MFNVIWDVKIYQKKNQFFLVDGKFHTVFFVLLSGHLYKLNIDYVLNFSFVYHFCLVCLNNSKICLIYLHLIFLKQYIDVVHMYTTNSDTH